MSDDFDLSLFGDTLVKPSSGESADPIEVLADKVVRVFSVECFAFPFPRG
jgi:hypothetical protein